MDIVGLIFWAMYMGRKTQAKGYTKGRGVGIAVGFWLGLELGLGIVGLVIGLSTNTEEATCIAFPLAIIGIGLGIHHTAPGIQVQRASQIMHRHGASGSVKRGVQRPSSTRAG